MTTFRSPVISDDGELIEDATQNTSRKPKRKIRNKTVRANNTSSNSHPSRYRSVWFRRIISAALGLLVGLFGGTNVTVTTNVQSISYNITSSIATWIDNISGENIGLTTLSTQKDSFIITIPASSEEGRTLQVSVSGTYIFEFVGGGYCVRQQTDMNPPTQDDCRTHLVVFRNDSPIWNGSFLAVKGDNIWTLLDNPHQISASKAEYLALENPDFTIYLNADDTLTFVVYDMKGEFGNNSGNVRLRVTVEPEYSFNPTNIEEGSTFAR